MSDRELDLDRSVEEAWRGFRARLADHLAQMSEDDVLVVEVAGEWGDDGAEVDQGTTPYVQFLRWVGEPTVRAEVSSNAYLAEPFALDADAEAALTAMGWQSPPGAPEPGNFVVDVPVREVDRLAVMAVRALREVFGVVHPAFVDADGLEVDPETAASGGQPGHDADGRDDDEPLAVIPESADHLRELVGSALVPLLGREPEADGDGDIPVIGRQSLVYVRVEEEAPVVQLFSFLVQDVTDRQRARREINVLNKEFRFIKFALVRDRVMARIYLPSWPFVPEHLRSMVSGMIEALDDLEDDVVDRLGGRRMGEEGDVAEADHTDGAGRSSEAGLAASEPGACEAGTAGAEATEDARDCGSFAHTGDSGESASEDDVALQTLLQLDAGGGGTLDPELVAGICGHDQRRVLRLLRISEQQEIAWREARDTARESGDAGEARACAHELRAWSGTSDLLRKVLWLVVRETVGEDPSAEVPRSGSGRPGGARRVARSARRQGSNRPRPQRQVRDAADLTAHFGADRMDTVARALAARSATPVRLEDHETYLEVALAGGAAMLSYPFALGELYALVASLEHAAGHGQQARQGE